METSSSNNNSSTAPAPATTARTTIHNYQGIKKHLIEAIVFSAENVFACSRERLISYDNNEELTGKVDALFHRKRSRTLSSHAAREIRQQDDYGEENGNESFLRVNFVDTTSTCPSTSPSLSSPSDFYYSSKSSSNNSRRKNRKELEAIPDVPLSLLRLLDVQQEAIIIDNELVDEQLPVSKTTTLLSLSAKATAAATDDGTTTTKKSSSSSKPRIRKNKRRLLHDLILNHIVCFKGKTTKSVVLESIQKEKEEKEKNENENHYHHPLRSHSHCHHHQHHLSSTNTNTTIASLFHDDHDDDADHDDDVNKKGSNTTHRRFRRRKNKKSLRHIMGVSYLPSTATATATAATTTTTHRTLCWQRRQPFEQRRSCCVVMGS